jgi:hypothetical protein
MARSFGFPDNKMIEFSGAYRLGFIGKKAPFIALDPEFDLPFEDDWLTAINASIAEPSAEYRQDQQILMTNDVKAKMVDARKSYRLQRYFVTKAFPGNTDLQNLFGLDNYADAINSQKEMCALLTDMHRAATTAPYAAGLAAAGYPAADIAAILTIRDALNTGNWTQDDFIRNSPIATVQRENTHNATWAFAQRVRSAAGYLFMDDVEMYNFFLFPASEENESIFNILGFAKNAATGAVITGVNVKLSPLGINTTTDLAGKFGYAAIPAGTYMITFIAPGFADLTKEVIVPASGQVTVNAEMTPTV